MSDAESILDDAPDPNNISLSVRMPIGEVREWWHENDIAMWVKVAIYRVMQVDAEVEILSLIKKPRGMLTCTLQVGGIPDDKRARFGDVLHFCSMEQCVSPHADTEEMYSGPLQHNMEAGDQEDPQ